MILKAPMPYFGGKREVAAEIWRRLGDVVNYVEPCFGSGAVLLARPEFRGSETVNDACGFIANLWRAIQADPVAVAGWCDWPVSERDLEARHYWLVTEGRRTLDAILGDPLAFDAKIAGWWCWGACSWIGSGWCTGEGPWWWAGGEWVQGLDVGNAGQGINRQLPHVGNAGQGINRQLPHVGDAGQGINRQLPHVGDAGRGINRKLPHVGDAKTDALVASMRALADRLRGVRICCGDWERVCGPSVTHRHGLTGVFLDPPYGLDADRTAGLYVEDDLDVARRCREWALEEGKNPAMRIALAGYADEHELPGWTAFRWKARGGFGSQGDDRGRENCERETLWFSPHCLRVDRHVQARLFG